MSTVELVRVGALFTPARVAVAGFLAGYSGQICSALSRSVRDLGLIAPRLGVSMSSPRHRHGGLARWRSQLFNGAPRAFGVG